MPATKRSKQRDCILSYLTSVRSHPTADQIYQEVQKMIPNISLGTVYRNLNLLAGEGTILRISCGDGVDHFDATVTPHNHFICHSCGCVLDLEMDSIDHINTIAGAGFSGMIEGHVTYFYGQCPKCCKKQLTN
ncbi:MAG: transcriptional repressor [Clostridiales bacterium]|nr:transcriptional repressor [Clostridiales bacterium]